MTTSLYAIDPGPQCPEVVRMIVEIPMLSSNKIEYDNELGVFRLDRRLYSPMHYPGDYGFVPGTLSDDGDPLDVLALVTQPSFTGCLMEVRPVGALHMIDAARLDQKILAVPVADPRFDKIQSVDELAPHIRREIEHFFDIYKELEGKQTQIEGWHGREDARALITRARQAYLGRSRG